MISIFKHYIHSVVLPLPIPENIVWGGYWSVRVIIPDGVVILCNMLVGVSSNMVYISGWLPMSCSEMSAKLGNMRLKHLHEFMLIR